MTPLATMRASGVMPRALALVSLMTMTAAAPSLSGQALPAVTVPPSRNTGWRLASPSRVVLGRGPSSFTTTVPSASVTGMISRSKNPFCWDSTARVWESSANSSCSARPTFSNSATFSAVWPMAMYTSGRPAGGLQGSVTAGARTLVRSSAAANSGLWGPVSDAPCM